MDTTYCIGAAKVIRSVSSNYVLRFHLHCAEI